MKYAPIFTVIMVLSYNFVPMFLILSLIVIMVQIWNYDILRREKESTNYWHNEYLTVSAKLEASELEIFKLKEAYIKEKEELKIRNSAFIEAFDNHIGLSDRKIKPTLINKNKWDKK